MEQKKQPPPICLARKRFDGYGKLQRAKVRLPKLEPADESIQKRFMEVFERHPDALSAHNIRQIIADLKSIPGFSYSARDVEKLCFRINDFRLHEIPDFFRSNMQACRMGVFISALIEHCDDSDFTLVFFESKKPISNLGSRNTKNVHIFGDVGSNLANEMLAGRVVLDGNATFSCASFMRGGELIINGDAGLVNAMNRAVAIQMTGGIIHLNGDFSDIEGLGGKIFHNGELIFDRPDIPGQPLFSM